MGCGQAEGGQLGVDDLLLLLCPLLAFFAL